MGRLLALACVASAVLLLASPTPAAACEKCTFKLDCQTDPDCTMILVCQHFPRQNGWDCTMIGSDECDPGPRCWYVQQQPPEEDALAFLASASPVGGAPRELCSDLQRSL